MGQAIEILEKITGTRTNESKGYSFVQLSLSKKIEDPRKLIVNLLRKAGNTKTTHALVKLADKIASLKQTPGSGTFDSIKNMIQKMIFHLMSEQKDEDDHKNWCDKEVDQTTMMQEDKNENREELSNTMELLTSEIDELKVGMEDNNREQVEAESSIEEMTDTRAENKAENDATIKDAEMAQTAVDSAIAVLEEFYKSTGAMKSEAWEFVQTTAHEDPPDTGFSGEYQGVSDADSEDGVVGLLRTIATDFASMESQARADETAQQDAFDTELTATQVRKAGLIKDTEMKSSRKDRLAEKLEGKTADAAHNQKELDATNQYWKDLQGACFEGDSTYEERKAARTQETEALREAQGILENAFKEPAEGDAAPAS